MSCSVDVLQEDGVLFAPTVEPASEPYRVPGLSWWLATTRSEAVVTIEHQLLDERKQHHDSQRYMYKKSDKMLAEQTRPRFTSPSS